MESDKLYENINNKTLQDKLTIIDKFKLKLVDYIESELIFQDEKTLEEYLGQIGLTFTEYKSYSQYLKSIIRFSKEDKINNLNDYIEFINAIKDIPSFLEGIDIVEETMDKHIINNIEKILELEVKLDNQNEYIDLLSLLCSCKDYFKDDYDKVASYIINKYIHKDEKISTNKEENLETNINIEDKKEDNISYNTSIINQFIPNIEIKQDKIEIEERKKEKKSESIVDIFKELIAEELNQKENNQEIINELYEEYKLKKKEFIECKIIRVDNSYLYLEKLDNHEDNLIIKMRKIPLHNYRVGAKEKGYISEINKTEEGVEIFIVKSIQSIDALQSIIEKETKPVAKKKTTKSTKLEDNGGYSEKYFKDLFNKIKSELGITLCNLKKCAYDSTYGALIIIDNKKKNSHEEIKFVESLMNKRCGEDIVKIIEFKYDAIEFLSHVFNVDKSDIIKGTGKYIVVNYDTNMVHWYKFMTEQINSMVNYKIEF
ncbi:MAG: hypothetical protein IJ086_01830 [Clostridium sp.]|nr:hypothetical protein [Clostridium sp.]